MRENRLSLRGSLFCFAVAVAIGLADQLSVAVDESVAPTDAASTGESLTFTRDVDPLLRKLCGNCHGPQKAKADLQLSLLDHELANGKDAEAWQDVLDRVNIGEMPPPKAKQPTKADDGFWLSG